MCELAQGCSPLLLPLAARRCCCLELAAAAARRSAAAAEASALGAGAVGVGGCAQLRWSATGMRSVSSALLLAKRLRAAALVGDRYAVRFLGSAACEAAAAFGSLPVLLATWIFAPPQAGEKDERRFEKRNLCSRVPRLRVHVAVFWSHAKSSAVLGGTLGENAAWCSGHGSSAQEDGCGLSPAAGPERHVVLCGHRSVFSSPPGRQNVSPPRIFSTNPQGKNDR